MNTKYYHTQNATRPIKKDGFEFTFTGYSNMGGTWRGVLQSDDPKEQAVLDKLADDKRTGITSITTEEYEATLKKNPLVTPVSPVFDPSLPLQAQIVKGQVVVVNEPPETKAKGAVQDKPTPLPVAQAVEVGDVTPMDPVHKHKTTHHKK